MKVKLILRRVSDKRSASFFYNFNAQRLMIYDLLMRVLQISSAQNFGGGEKHFVDLTIGLHKRGHEMFIALRRQAMWRNKLSVIPKNNIFEFSLINALDLQSAWQLAQVIKHKKIEIVHAHLARDYTIAALAVRFSREDVKLVLTRHVLFDLNRFYKFLLPPKTIFIAVSKAVEQSLQRQNLVSPKNVRLVLNGVETLRFETAQTTVNRQSFARQFQLPPENLFVGIVGEIAPHKGQLEFVEAAVLLNDKWPNVYFLIVGLDSSPQGLHVRKVEETVEKLGLTEKVRFLGWLDDVASVMAALDVFVSASHFESFGFAIVEAMAAGCAIVATETEGASEILKDKETGRLVPIKNAAAIAEVINELLSDKDARKVLGAKAQATAHNKFGLERMITETEQVYLEVLEQN